MPVPTMDFETYSEAGFVWNEETRKWQCLPNAPQGKKGLKVVGATVYSEHPTADILTLSYDIGQGLRRWQPGQPLPHDLFAYLASGGIIEAHRAMFERLIWENVAVPKYGFPPLNPHQLRCSMATAHVNNLPGALANLGTVLGTATQKDKDGTRLLNKFSIPRNPTKADPRTRIRPQDDPADAEKLYAYCDTDVIAEQGAVDRMEPMSADELEFWLIDQEINHRGLAVDREGVANCIAVLEQCLSQYGQEFRQLTGGLEPGQLAETRGWLAAQGVHLPDMQAETITLYLKKPDLPPQARRALEIRDLTGSASVKKLYALAYSTGANGRVRDLIVHHGARTGRPTGEGAQPLNMPRAGPPLVTCGACQRPHKKAVDACPWCAMPCPPIERKAKWSAEMVPHVLEIMAARSLGLVEWFFGDALLAISGCLRGLFIAAEAHDLIASDYSAIEAVVAAEISGETWRQETLAAGKDIYLASASKITGRTYEFYLQYKAEHGDHHPDRQDVGKIAELALSYGGWEGAWRAFDPAEADKSTAEIESIIRAWRDASPQIVAMWGGQRRRAQWGWIDELYGIEGAVIRAIMDPGSYHVPNPPSDGSIKPFPVQIGFYVRDAVRREWLNGRFVQGTRPALVMVLPSGREIKYWEPRLEPSAKRPGTLAISYMTWNTNPKYGPLGWIRMSTWGSRIFENADQAIAHDLLRGAIRRLRMAGYPTVLHVYDEIVVEVPEGLGSVEEVERLMAPTEEYARGWPIRASGGWRGKRYRKG